MRYERRKSGALTTLLVLIMMLGCISFLTAATTGKIAGKIVDNESGDALPGANVIITGTTMGAATDASGHFFIINVPPGKYSVKASMMGYGAVIKTEVFVTIGHTTPLDFELGMEAIAGEEIVLVAEREIIKKDMSSSVVTSSIEDMQAMPMVSNVGGYANLLAGVDGWNIRGGRADETEFLMDGLLMVDNLGNRALTMPNLTSVEQVNIIKGGFNAEYGNVRSGVVNMVTKKSSFEKYHASAEFRYKPAQMEHRGPSLFSHDTYFLRSYLDETNDLAYLGTQSLPEHLQSEYKPFIGWNQYVENEGKGQTPEQARDMFLWLTRAEGADELLEKYGVTNYDGPPREVEYSNKPNLMLDATVGGPVPFVKNMSFLASHRNDKQMWVIPAHPYDREAYREHQSQLKLTYKMTENLEVGLDGLYKKVKSISDDQTWAGDPYMYGQTDPVGGAYAQFNRTGTVSTWWGAGNPSFQTNLDLYSPESNIAFDRTSKMMGLSVDHVLSPNTFYNIRVSYISTDNDAPGRYLYNYGNTDNPLEGRYEDYIPDSLRYDLSRDVGTLMRDTTKVIWFGPVGIDMAPYGIVGKSDLYAQSWIQDPPLEIENRGFTFNFSTSKTINVRGDLTSQINRYNQVKTGFTFNYDDLNSWYGNLNYPIHGSVKRIFWEANPIRIGAYIQDKLEFEGMIANIGLRLDYSNARAQQYDLDSYSPFFYETNKWRLTEEAPSSDAEAQIRISPRFGISHPIGDKTKLFFNYGWFSSMPTSQNMYTMNYGYSRGFRFLANPSLKMPRTIAYEFGAERNIADMFLFQASGYYKDITDEPGQVTYQDYDGLIDYGVMENIYYRDIRGIELRFEKRWGRWFTGWANYDYKVTTSGRTGRVSFFQDPRQELRDGLADPYQSKPLAEPLARFNAAFYTPKNWGPKVMDIHPLADWSLSMLYTWRAGYYHTWDPLDTKELYLNIQTEPWKNLDLKLSKSFEYAGMSGTFYLEVRNMLDTKHLNIAGFMDNDDFKNYMESLHLPMYDDERYEAVGYVGGDDRWGDFRDDDVAYDPWEANPDNDPEIAARNEQRLKDKSYINMPNNNSFSFLFPRQVTFGIRYNF